MAVAVRNLALVVPQRALLALPARVALALAVDVFAALRAQHRTDACKVGNVRFKKKWIKGGAQNVKLTLAAVVASVAGIALTVAEQALAVAGAPVRAVLGHVFCDRTVKGDLLRVTVVVVDRQEPVAGLHVAGHLSAHRRL